ncbi:MAG TPA: hypothetical protein VF188_09375 [Longimicrobiales bacterium]
MRRLRDSFFEDCIFDYAAGVSTDTWNRVDIYLDTENIVFISCRFLHSPNEHGLRSYGKNVTVFGGEAQFNGRKGLAMFGDCGSVTATFVGGNGTFDGENEGIMVGYDLISRCIAVRNCFMNDNHIRLDDVSRKCIAENNLLGAGSRVDDFGIGNLDDLNVDA